MKALVTGGNGFVGSALVKRLLADELATEIVSIVRCSVCDLSKGVEHIVIDGIDESNDWRHALLGCEVVLHLAARVHVMQEAAVDPLDAFRRVNVKGTLNLASQAAAAGVQRFLFVSSIKVNGEVTQLGRPFTADDVPAPKDAYAISKMEAEQGLREIARQTGMDVVIIRPPLVYGPGVKANFSAMIRWLKSGVPMPLGAIHNQRSFVGLDNLTDLLVTCITHPGAANQTFLVSDDQNLSTTELLCQMGQAIGHPARLIPVPTSCLKLVAAMVGKSEVYQRLSGSLEVDIEKTRRLLGWSPPVLVVEGLRQVAQGSEFETNI